MTPSEGSAAAVTDPNVPQQDLKPTRRRHLKRGPFATVGRLLSLFSYDSSQRKAPTSNKTQHIRLITIRPSHYCEKGRWALDLCEDDENSPYYYTEDAHPPAFAAFSSVKASNDVSSAAPLALFTDVPNKEKKQLFLTSDEILEHFCPHLYPAGKEEQVKAMVKDLGDRLGATIRVVAYHYMLQKEYQPGLVTMCAGDGSAIEDFLFAKMLPNGLEKGMRRVMKINQETATSSMDILRRVFEEYSHKLEKKQYFIDDTFTAADLTFASLASPLIRPKELACFQCRDDQIHPTLLKFARELTATRAGQHVLNMYERHRFLHDDNDNNLTPTSATTRLVKVRTEPRNRIPWSEMGLVVGGVAVVAVGVNAILQRSKL